MHDFLRRDLRRRRAIGGGVAGATVAAIVLAGGLVPLGAAAAPGDHSEAHAQFLSGSLLDGLDLSTVAGLAGTEAINTGAGTVTDANDLDLTLLSALNVNIPSGATVPLGDLLALGAVNQFSEAQDAGISRAASGAVSDSGIVDTTGTGTFPASATLDLMELLGTTSLLSDANLSLQGVTGVAALDGANAGPLATSCASLSAPEHCRDYNIAGATSELGVPALEDITTTATNTLTTLSTTLNGLTDELLQGLLDGVTDALDEILAVIPGVSLVSNDLTVDIDADLAAALDPVLNQDITVGGVTLNVGNGTVTVDWENILGLNGLAPNTALISPTTLNTVADNIADALAQLQGEITTALTTVLDNVGVVIDGGVCVLEALGICTVGLDIDYDGSLQDLLDSTEPLDITATGATGPLLNPILSLLGPIIQGVTSTAVLPLVNTALTTAGTAISTVVDAAGTALSGVVALLGTVLNVTVNVQEEDVDGPGTFTEVAARLQLLGGTLLTVDLGKAVVGANQVGVPATVDADSTVVAGQDLGVTGANWTPGATVTLRVTGPGADTTLIGSEVTVTADGTGNLPTGTNYPVPYGTAPGTYTLSAADTSGKTATDTTNVTAPVAEVDAAGSVPAGSNLGVTGSGWAPNSTVSLQLTAPGGGDIGGPVVLPTDADGQIVGGYFVPDTTPAAPGYLLTATQGATTATDTTEVTEAPDPGDANTNAAASASASADATADGDPSAQAAAVAAAFADASSAATAAANGDASLAAQSAALADASTDASTASTSTANASAAVAAQAAAQADASDDVNAAATAAANANSSTAADAAATATSSADASNEASTNANAAASAAASANADASTDAVADPAAQAAAYADATSAASAAADADATGAADVAATATASSTASTDATSAANANAAVAAQAAALADASSSAQADASAATNANASSAAEAAALANASTDASVAAVGNADASAAAAATATATATATASADASAAAVASADASAAAVGTASASAAADPDGGIGITVKHPVLHRGEQQTAVGTGFQPGEVVTGVMTSDPLALGTQVANALGTVTFTWTIPAGTDLGAHTVTLTGALSGSVAGQFQVVELGLAGTGAEVPTGWIMLGVMLLILALGAALVARSKRAVAIAE